MVAQGKCITMYVISILFPLIMILDAAQFLSFNFLVYCSSCCECLAALLFCGTLPLVTKERT